MKKNQNLTLMVFGLIVLVTQIITLVLHSHFGNPFIYPGIVIDSLALLAIAFFLIIQMKNYIKFVSLFYLSYSVIGIFYSLFSDMIASSVGLMIVDQRIIFSLCLILGYALVVLAALFTIIHVFQGKFETKVTRGFVGALFAIAFLLFLGATIVASPNYLADISTNILAVVSIGFVFGAILFTINDDTLFRPTEKTHDPIKELRRLYINNVITKEEYETRVSSLKKE